MARGSEPITFGAYRAVWLALQNGESVDTEKLLSMIAHPEQFEQRLEAHGREKLWGVFTSCTPHKDVLFDYLMTKIN